MRVRLTIFAVALLSASIFAPAAHAFTIGGDTFSAGYRFPTVADVYATDSNFVADGSTKQSSTGIFSYAFTADKLTFTFLTDGTFNPTDFNGPTFTDLTRDLSGFSLLYDAASTDSDMVNALLSINGSNLFLNWRGLTIATGQTAVFDIGPTAATPEPSSLILLASGVLGAVGVARRVSMRNSFSQ